MNQQVPFEVSRTPLSKQSASFRSMVFSFSDPQIAKIRPTAGIWVFSFVFALLGIGVIVLSAVTQSEFADMGTPDSGLRGFWKVIPIFRLMVSGIVGVGFVTFSVYFAVAAARRTLTFDRRSGTMHAKRNRTGLDGKIPLRDFAAVQVLPAGTGEAYTYEMNLVLSQPAGHRFTVMCHAKEQDLRSDASKLAEFLQVPVLDHTHEPEVIDGRVLELERALLPGSTANFRTMVLRSAGPGQMSLKATMGAKVFRGIFVGFGLLALGMGVIGIVFFGSISKESVWWGLLAVAIPIIVGTVLTLAGFKFLTEHPIVFDRVRGSVQGRSLKTDDHIRGEIALRDIRALQICSGMISNTDGEGKSYRAFQLNLVLGDPPGQRIPLVAHAKGEALRRDAEQLAQFIRVPLLDHTKQGGQR